MIAGFDTCGSFEDAGEEAALGVLVSQVDNLAEPVVENVWEVVPLDDLLEFALVDRVEKAEAALFSVDQAHLVVPPFVVGILVQLVVALVGQVD